MHAISDVVLYFALYSFLGWVAEVLFVFVRSQKLENRGVLRGPFVPIYGFGALILVYLIDPFVSNPFLVFVVAVVASSVLEYVTHFLLDKLFHVRLWDYSSRPFNLHGRICLQNSLCFGALGLLLVYVIHPLAAKLIGGIPDGVAIAIASALLALLVADAADAIAGLAKVRPVLDRVKGRMDQVHEKIEADARAQHAELEQRKAERRADEETRGHRTRTAERLSRVFQNARTTTAKS